GRGEGEVAGVAGGLEQRPVEVAPVDHGVGRAKVLAEDVAAGNSRHLAVAERVDEDQVAGEHRLRLEVLHHPQPVEHAVGVRPLLDAVADLAELRRLLEQLRPYAAARERERARHPADASSDDEDFRTQNRQASPAITSPWVSVSPLTCTTQPPLQRKPPLELMSVI